MRLDQNGFAPRKFDCHQDGDAVVVSVEFMTRPRAADDFATIRARMEQLRREREWAKPTEQEAQRDPRPTAVAASAGRHQRWARPPDPPDSPGEYVARSRADLPA